jgi:hypothetical protein
MNKTLLSLVGMGCLALIIAGCGVVTQENQPILAETAVVQGVPTATSIGTEIDVNDTAKKETPPLKEAETSAIEPNAETAKAVPPPATLPNIPQPVNELADGEYYWSQLLARDAIAPIYEPQFAPAGQAPYEADELVIGVEINGEAKAYAIGLLNSREMVNDIVGGVPVLVTW